MARYTLNVGKSPQKTREFFNTEKGLLSDEITAAAISVNGRAYIGSAAGLNCFDGKKMTALDFAKGRISMLHADKDGFVWCGCGETLYKIKNDKAVYSQEIDSEAVAIDTDLQGTTWLCTVDSVYTFNGEGFEHYSEVDGGNALCMAACGEGDVFVSNPLMLMALHGKRPRWSGINPEISGMPTNTIASMAKDKANYIWCGTEEGLCLYDSKGFWLTSKDIEAFPKAEVTKIFISGDGAKYIGTKIGLYVLDGTKKKFIGFERWIPDEEVTAVAANEDSSLILVGTNKGVSLITTKMMTLREKADYYQAMTEKYNVRDAGFVTIRNLSEHGNVESGAVEVSDNDGLWTASYMACQVMRYAATKDKEALELARRSMKALLRLFKVSGIEGFVVRAYRRPGERGYGNGHHEWFHTTDDMGDLEWKCETSSDETTGHYYGFALYFDYCADKKEKEEISKVLCGMLDYIIANNYTLVDYDGKPTTWAHWTPEALNYDDKWFWERGINSLEMLSYLKTCYHFSGDEKYQTEYLRLIRQQRFAANCLQYRINDAHVVHIDDHLGFLAVTPLLMYETDPEIRQYYLMGINHHWESQRIERCPLWNVLYGVLTDEHCDIENAVATLEELPLDLLHWKCLNSKRPELVYDRGQEIFGGGKQLVAPLPNDEKYIQKYDGNPFRADGGNSMRFEDGTIFLQSYWLAKYFGLISD